ncbi:MAG TPA: MazG family protein [Verrucomicrobiae bacterium]|nr:MazG family protein [Verrucomicrobiae bacterium]
MKKARAIDHLLKVMAKLRSPTGCPWDREQDHRTLRWHAVEEVYELMDAIEADDDHEMVEELGDLLLQVVFHCQMASERGAFDFEKVTRHIVDKLIRRHPHVFRNAKAKTVDAVWEQWEQIKKAEKKGTRHERPSALDGIPKHLPSLLRVEKLLKKARKAGLFDESNRAIKLKKAILAETLFHLADIAQLRGWSAEDLLRDEVKRREQEFRKKERSQSGKE